MSSGDKKFWFVAVFVVVALLALPWKEVEKPPEPTNCVVLKKRPAMRFGLRKDEGKPYPVITPMWDDFVKCDGQKAKWVGEKEEE